MRLANLKTERPFLVGFDCNYEYYDQALRSSESHLFKRISIRSESIYAYT